MNTQSVIRAKSWLVFTKPDFRIDLEEVAIISKGISDIALILRNSLKIVIRDIDRPADKPSVVFYPSRVSVWVEKRVWESISKLLDDYYKNKIR